MPSKSRNYVGRNYKNRRHKDKLSKKQRSSLMSKIRSKNTGLEKSFLYLLKESTSRKFKTHVKTILGTPDIVFEKEMICIFLDGDFWHGWQFPRWKHQMKNEFWRRKIEGNRRRDKRVQRYLKDKGWTVIRFWEHEIQTKPHESIRIIKDHLIR
ncbi:MAG TPA: very short patch repair endonuclease [bacterium]|nr:very short patch repair endonuclease [bacterium]